MMRTGSLLVLMGLSSCITSAPYVEAELGAMAARVSGSAERESSAGVEAGDVSLGRDLGVGERQLAPSAAVRVGGFGLNATLSAFDVSLDGTGTLARGFGDIPAGADVETDLDLIGVKATATIDFVKTGPLRVAGGLGLEYLGFDLDVDSRLATITESISSDSIVPILVADGFLDLGPVQLRASIAGIDGEFGDVDGPLLDGELSARLSPFSFLDFFVGYRRLDFSLSGSDSGRSFAADVLMDGFLSGASVRF